MSHLLIVALCNTAAAQAGTDHDWTYYGGDAGSTRFSRLDQIDSTNVSQLTPVWSWSSADGEVFKRERIQGGTGHHENTPLAVDGVLYVSTPLNVIRAIDGTTGKTIWTFDPQAWKHEGGWTHRGVAYWKEGDVERILFGTSSDYLYALDARSGLADSSFGDNGRVDLARTLRRPLRPFERERYGVRSPPIVCRNVVVVGSSIDDYDDISIDYMIPGDVRGFDVRTGELLWTFHTVPQAGEYGNESWGNESWKRYGGANVWSMMSADQELGYVYLPVSSPSYDFYGGGRPGDNLFGDSIVCLDAQTGERIWHYQIVHHDLWNADLNSAPILVDILVDGKPIKAVVQLTKQAFCFVFDRVTGEPVWPIVEQPVPPSTVPGEAASPTQPFPTKPAPLDRQDLTEEALIDFTPEIRRETLEILKHYDWGPLYTPPSERGLIKLPGSIGGVDWAGGAVNPETGWLYVPTKTRPERVLVSPARDPEAQEQFINHHPGDLAGYQGLPLTKPPYGRLTAIDLNSGEHEWVIPLGNGPIEHPLLRDLDLPPLGSNARQFVLATPTLLLVAAGRAEHGRGQDPERYLRAFDMEDGRLIAEVDLPRNATGNPITYMAGGRQYIAVPTMERRRTPAMFGLAIPRPGEEVVPVKKWSTRKR